MEWTDRLFFIPLLCGVIFIFAGVIMLVFPPKKINALYGYRTLSSMRTIERWEFAQKYSAIQMLISAALLMVMSTFGLLIDVSKNYRPFVEIFLFLIAIGYMIWSTEKALRRKFPIKE